MIFHQKSSRGNIAIFYEATYNLFGTQKLRPKADYQHAKAEFANSYTSDVLAKNQKLGDFPSKIFNVQKLKFSRSNDHDVLHSKTAFEAPLFLYQTVEPELVRMTHYKPVCQKSLA